ncbi:MAG: electron transfer flavoprotein alpha subunit [bacterium]|jgi:electron transfer flavoprotein alpha subunit
MAKILVVADIKGGALKSSTVELVAKAKSLGAEVATVAVGSGIKGLAGDLAAAGSSAQYIADDASLELFSSAPYAAAITDAATQSEATQVWFASNETSKAVAPRVAARLAAGCASDIIDIAIDGAKVTVKRPCSAGKIIQNTEIKTEKAVIVVRGGAFDVETVAAGSESVVELATPEADLKAVIKEVVSEAAGEIDLSDADIVVSVGRGAKDADGVEKVRALATTLGAGFGASRAVVDGGLMPHTSQVGQTGKVVSPAVYFAVGISGAIQHVAGMGGSKVIVAVNKDPDAAIFSIADYGIVGDLFEVLPVMIEEIKKVRG